MRDWFSFLVLACALFVSGIATAESWARAYGPNLSARSLRPTADGGYVVAGSTVRNETGSTDALLMKLDDRGNVVWQRTFDGGGLDAFVDVYPATDGGYVVAGVTPSRLAGESDAWVAKLDASGDVKWQKGYVGLRRGAPSQIRPTSDGGYIVAGHSTSESGQRSGWVLKLDADGDVVWQKTYGSVPAGAFQVLQTKPGGGYVAAGAMFAPRVWVAEFDHAGNVVWVKTYAAPGDEVSVGDLRITADGGYVVVGSNFPFALDWSEGWILKLDPGGNILWQKTVGHRSSAGSNFFFGVQPTAEGGYVVVGARSGVDVPGRNAAASMWEFDAGGNLRSQKTYGGQLSDWFHAIQEVGVGGHVVLGITQSFGSGGDSVWVLKRDASEAPLGCINEEATAPSLVDRAASATDVAWIVESMPVIQRTLAIEPAHASAVMWQQCPVPAPSSQLIAIEYRHHDFDHYFVTTSRSEIVALDRGAIPGWSRTLFWFRAWGLDADAARVCRFWSSQTHAPKSSHFYTPLASECAEVWKNPRWQYEGQVFAMALPDTGGNCASGTTPLYRLYNDGVSGAPNHRYTTSPQARSDMISRGWIAEGVGTGVMGCVPPE